MYASFTTQRFQAIESFMQACRQAQWAAWKARCLGRARALLHFDDFRPRLSEVRKYRGVGIVRVAQITGSVGRERDFDAHFRPLKRHLCERWIAQLLALRSGGWAPIRAYKLGQDYFVEDGHHRVSVARFTGMEFIDAEIWEYELAAVMQAPTAVVASPMLVACPDDFLRPATLCSPQRSQEEREKAVHVGPVGERSFPPRASELRPERQEKRPGIPGGSARIPFQEIETACVGDF